MQINVKRGFLYGLKKDKSTADGGSDAGGVGLFGCFGEQLSGVYEK